nr:DUF402 domain-containing protein [Saccharibacillus sp. JS10]
MTLLEQREDFVIAEGKAGRKLKHHTKGQTFTIPHASLEVYALQEGFTVSFDIQNGKLISIYCNITQPCIQHESHVSFVDLDLDLLWNEAQGWHVVDEDEFADNQVRLNYPPELIVYARQALEDLQQRIAQHQFPFDGSLDPIIHHIANQAAEREV